MNRKTGLMVVLAAAGLCASAATAGPLRKDGKSLNVARVAPGTYVPTPNNPMDANFSENFDSYANGSGILGQGGWIPWNIPLLSYPPGFPPDGFVDNAQSSSSPNSLRIQLGTATTSQTDAVHKITAVGGKWTASIKSYVPSTSTGDGYFILNNVYNDTIPVPVANWSVQVHMNPATGLVTSDFCTPACTLPLITNQWVEIKCNIDLTVTPNGTLDIFYNGQPLAVGKPWLGNVSTPTGGALEIQAVDLYSDTNTGMYFDDFKVTQVVTCYPDCNGDGVLGLADFGCFQTKFALGDPYADCNGDGILGLADFGCFQTKFALGCP
jgi:hypothetical protein